MNPPSRLLVAITLSIVASACADAYPPTSPVASSKTVYSQTGYSANFFVNDSTSWVDNVLEYQDHDGSEWRWVRDQEDATVAWFYKDDALQLSVEIFHTPSGDISGYLFESPGEAWWETDAAGEVVASAFAPGGSAPVNSLFDDCESERVSFFSSAAQVVVGAGAVIGSGLVGLKYPPAKNISVAAMGWTGAKISDAVDRGATWWFCEQEGEDDDVCEDFDPVCVCERFPDDPLCDDVDAVSETTELSNQKALRYREWVNGRFGTGRACVS